MVQENVNYDLLESDYSNPDSLSYKKIRLVDSFIPSGGILLDIGSGTGELISLRFGKHEKIFGIDNDERSLQICRERFGKMPNITLAQASIDDVQSLFDEKIECVTCLDVLEHIDETKMEVILNSIYTILNSGGVFIFTGPGIFEKIRILLGLSPTHLHSHSSYGWRSYIENAGFTIHAVESVEFPVIHSNFLRKNFHLFGKCCVIVAQK